MMSNRNQEQRHIGGLFLQTAFRRQWELWSKSSQALELGQNAWGCMEDIMGLCSVGLNAFIFNICIYVHI